MDKNLCAGTECTDPRALNRLRYTGFGAELMTLMFQCSDASPRGSVMVKWAAVLAGMLALLVSGHGHCETYAFGVLNQRSATLTAQYWNPILDYVGKKAGVTLAFRMGKDVAQTYAMTRDGEFDFVYSNHIFTPSIARVGYEVILRPNEEAIQGQIVVAATSPVSSLTELRGKEVGFPSTAAFVAYAVTMDQLAKQGIEVIPTFGGNQEGVMAQLKAGSLVAASVNSKVMREYSERTGFRYRVLWSSPDFLNIPIAANPRVPKDVVAKVRQALDHIDNDPEGLALLKASADVVHQPPPYGFRSATDREYANYRVFYQNTVLKDLKP
jgi:phosphonate transport system substrate-binding protein